MNGMRAVCGAVLAGLLLCAAPVFAQPLTLPVAKEGIALHGEPKYPAGFTHFDYVNADAPKGGDLHMWSMGAFDTVNPFTLKGLAADGSGMVFESLMVRSEDEPYSEYGWLAESVTVAPDKTWVSYKLRPEARFSDGTPVTPEDVLFSLQIMRDKGAPGFSSYYKDVIKAEKTGPREVKFTFRDGTNTELPMITGELPVVAKHDWDGKDFSATTLTPIIGSGPYKIESLTQGRQIIYARNQDWWAKDLPVNKGRYNFDRIIYDCYRDSTVALEAFLAGRYDFRSENVAKLWALDYNTPAVAQGLIKKQEIKNELPAGMQAFVLNIRRPLFQDRRVREALNYAYDFEWANKNFAYDSYTRTASYFENSELAAKGLPSAAELKLLEPYRGKVPDEVFTQEFTVPKTDGSGENRENLKKAADLLQQAGWVLKNGTLVDAQGKAFTFDIIGDEPAFERWVGPYRANLKRLGITANFRSVDASQFQNLMNDFNYDVIIGGFGASLSPGNAELDTWLSSKADVRGSSNYIGVRDPVVDALLEKLVHAGSREELVTATRALDRVLLWQYYVVPQWYLGKYRIAYWDKFGQPKIAPKYGLAVTDSWWVDQDKVGKIDAAQNRK